MSSFLIGVTGGSGSGKSTVSEALLERLGPDKIALMGEDNYYWPRAHYGAEDWPAVRIEDEINFDDYVSKDMDMFESHLKSLKQGHRVEQPVYDFAAHDRVDGAIEAIEPKPIILVEGIHALSIPQIADLFDLKVYVSTPDDIRLARRIKRDVNERGRDVNRVITQYLKFVRPTHYRCTAPVKYTADLVIADEGLPAYGQARPSPEAVERMIAPILGRLPNG